jgi:DNA-binding transcriptional MerR regulator
MMNEPFSKKQIVEALAGIVDIHEREIGYWTDLGIVEPGIAHPKGRGYTRYYNFDNVVDFAVAKRMADAGLSLKAIKLAMNKFKEEAFTHYFLNFLGRQIVVVANPNSEDVSVEIIGLENNVHGTIAELDMAKARAYFVIDVTDTIEKVKALEQ